jgi:hypothetical protein
MPSISTRESNEMFGLALWTEWRTQRSQSTGQAALARAAGLISAVRGRQKNSAALEENPRHPSLQLKRGRLVLVGSRGLNYRALAVEASHWGRSEFWIGSHAEYFEKIKSEAS